MSDSPILFAKESVELLRSGDVDGAMRLCEKGISAFPEYPGGWLAMAQIYFERGDLENARKSVSNGLKDYPNYKPLQHFIDVIDDTNILMEPPDELPENEDYETITDEAENVDIEEPDKKIVDIVETEKEQKEETSFLRLVKTFESNEVNENQLRADNPALIPGLAFTPLRATRRTQVEHYTNQPLHFPEFYNPSTQREEDANSEQINSELYSTGTMAEILESQGALKQAIEIYETLLKVNPDKAKHYKDKIAELTQKLND